MNILGTLRALVLTLMGCLLLSGQARADDMTLAVLPLDKASASEDYAGLGKALAGMLVTDLSGVPGLTLVERDRLQALLDELELNQSDFVDPKHAQELGQGLGARYVLAGSFSVVGTQFVLDARVVNVESGKIHHAADAQGVVTDFVSVEKELVESLLEGLAVTLSSSIRRQLYTATPTEDFGAFSAYGEGIAAQDAGDLEAAQAAYQRAVAADPDFAEARSALAEIKAAMSEYLAQRQVKYDTVYRSMNLRVLEQTVDMREYDGPLDMPVMAHFALRLSALENEGMDCQRMAEMKAYLERVDYRATLPEPVSTRDAQGRVPGWLGYETDKLAEEMDFRSYAKGTGGPAMAHQSRGRAASLFDGTHNFLFDKSWNAVVSFDPTNGYLSSMSRCFEGEELMTEFDALQEALERQDLLGLEGRHDYLTLGLELDAVELHWRAQQLGSSQELARASERFLARIQIHDPLTATDDDRARESWGLGVLERVVRNARTRDLYHATLQGLTQEQMLAFMRGVAAKDPQVVTLDGMCSYWGQSAPVSVRSSLKTYEEELADEDWYWQQVSIQRAGEYYAPMRDMGCVVGEEARYENLRAVLPMLQGAALQVQDKSFPEEQSICESLGNSLVQVVESYSEMLHYIEGQPSEPAALAGSLHTYHQLRIRGCLD